MLGFLPLLILRTEPAAAWFDGCLRAHRSAAALSAKLEVRQVLNGRTTLTNYEIAVVRPDRIKMRIREPQQGGQAASDRTFALLGNQFFGYDAAVHERLGRQAIPVGSMLQKLNVLVGRLDDSAAAILDPERMETFLAPFRKATGWQVRTQGAQAIVSRTASGRTTFRFEVTTRRLRGVRIEIPTGRLEWSILYSDPPKSIDWRPPKDAPVVASFTLRAGPPTYATPQARTIAERSMRAYDRLQQVQYQSEGSGGPIQVWLSGGRAREDNGRLAYVLNGPLSAIRDPRSRKFYQGKAGLNSMITAVAKLGSRVDPILKQMLSRQNPVRMLLMPGTTVRRIGNVSIGGADGDILEFDAAASTVTLVVRKDNGLLSSLRSVIRDGKKQVLYETERTFVYGSFGKQIDPATFRLSAPKEYRKLKLSELTR